MVGVQIDIHMWGIPDTMKTLFNYIFFNRPKIYRISYNQPNSGWLKRATNDIVRTIAEIVLCKNYSKEYRCEWRAKD